MPLKDSLARVMRAGALLIGAVTLFGGAVKIGLLTSFSPGAPHTPPLLAGSILLLALALPADPLPASFRRAFGAAGTVLGASGFVWPGNSLHPLAATGLVLIGAAVVLGVRGRRGVIRDGAAVAAIVMGLLALEGYILQVLPFYQLAWGTAIPIPVAAAVVVLGVALFAGEPESSLMRLVSAQSTGGVVVRRLLIVPFVLPLATGTVRLLAVKSGVYPASMGVWTFSMANILVFTFLIWWVGNLLDRIDRQRVSAQDALRQANELLEERVRERTGQLAASEAGYRTLAEAVPQIVWTATAEGGIEYVNQRWYEYSGFDVDQTMGTGWQAAVHSEDRQHCVEQWQQAAEAMTAFSMEFRLRRADGNYRWHQARAVPLPDDRREPLWLGTCTDIHEQKLLTDALTESESNFRLLFAQNPQPMWVFDGTSLQFLEVNEAAIAHYGYSREEFLAMSVLDIRPEEEIPRFLEVFRNHPPALRDAGLWIHRRKDGRILHVQVNAHSVQLSGRDSVLTLITDVTERRVLEEQLRQSQKMEAVGRLAGGIAHDFNNLLTVIAGYSSLLVDKMNPADEHRVFVQEILLSSQRAAALTQQLLAFSRRQVLQPQQLDLNVVVERSRKLLERLIGEDVRLTYSLRKDLWPVHADPGQIEQVIMNLAVNARDAMPHGGILSIETSHTVLGDEYSLEHVDVKPGSYVVLAVTDNGHGMDAETRSRVFEPFFTTKDQGKGTGLGLSMVYGIVKQSGGNVWVYSEPGHGTTFRVYLPKSAALAGAGPEAEAVTPLRGRVSGSILLVEDEQGVRRLAARMLEERGYTVLTAQSGKEALQLCAERDRIDLLLSDLVLPDTDGLNLASLIAEKYPGIRVVFMSGYTEHAALQRGAFAPGALFLQKPFTPAALENKIQEAMGGQSSKADNAGG
ncbi:MAG: PAS domain S-box protein [Bryobacteraceae bacterium]